MSAILPTPRKLFRLFDRGKISRSDLQEAMAVHASRIVGEIVEAKRNPFSARVEQTLNRRAASRLIRRHGESVVRDIFVALSEEPDFAPANLLWNADHWDVPLHCFLRSRFEPVFRVVRIEEGSDQLSALVTVEHGSARRKETVREEFSLRRHWKGPLVVQGRRMA